MKNETNAVLLHVGCVKAVGICSQNAAVHSFSIFRPLPSAVLHIHFYWPFCDYMDM